MKATDDDVIDYFDLLPPDLAINNIFSKLPVKSIAQCRCVSKLWSSTIRRQNYNQLFPTKSPPPPPRLLLAVEVGGDLLFYSSPQPQNPVENSSFVATFLHKTCSRNFYQFSRSFHGLISYQDIGKNYTFAVITNPITGQSLTLPKLSKIKEKTEVKASYSFGYDPIDQHFKVLCCTSNEYKVLTLGNGNGNLLWRNIKCYTIHYPLYDNGICINGVLYYTATMNHEEPIIVCFDVRSEEFSFTEVDLDMVIKILNPFNFTLIDYKGKLGACNCYISEGLFELWVLEDSEKHKWSKHIYKMPDVSETSCVRPVGMICSDVIVLSPCYTQNPFFVFYYNLVKNIITRVVVEVPLFKELKHRGVYTFPNYVENVKLI